ncbi:TonB-dependent receptor plug domain-containing protein [bacterium]|nr:TonB-dependent receptor plug domain-containing protein [bacterium]
MKYNGALLFFVFNLLLAHDAFAQKKVSISGYVKDASTGEDLVGANIYVEELKTGVATNVYGFFSLQLLPGTYHLQITFLGYNTIEETLELKVNTTRTFQMQLADIQTDEVVITAERSDKNVQSTEMSKIEIQVEQLREIPVLFGETDIIKTIQLLPGIQSTGDGNSGFYVRGGGPDQNLILLDEAVVYNASHLFGFFSVFNADAIKNVSILKGGMPANYGGRLSSVLNIQLNDGNSKELHGKGGVGIISSRLYLEGPLKKDKSSFMIAGRRTYADVLAQPFLNDRVRGNRYYFYDLNAKVNYILNPNNRLYLSGYFGRDVFSFKDNTSKSLNPPTFNSDWGNSTVTLRWNHLFSDRLFSNNSFIYNDYKFTFGGGISQLNFKFHSAIKDLGVKSDFDYFLSNKVKLKFGGLATHHTFNPGAASVGLSDQEIKLTSQNRLAIELAAYLSSEVEVSDRLNITMGLRYSAFDAIGPYKEAVYDAITGAPTFDTLRYSKWQSMHWYHAWEPRLAFRYLTSPNSSIKGSLTKNAQYLHLASISGGTLPTDLWLPSSKYIKPQIAYQAALGYFRNLRDNKYESSVEVFYKPLKNQIDFMPGTNLFLADEIDRNVLIGKGLAYGLELFIKKVKGKLTGWIGYTLSKTTRTNPPLNNGNPYFPRYDRRHDVSVLATYHLNNKWKFSAVWVFATGIAYTPTVGRYFGNIGIEGINAQNIMPFFDVITIYPNEYNTARLKPYERFDISVIYKPEPKKEKWWNGEWNLSVFNAFNRKNPYFIYNDTDVEAGVNERKMVYFPILPSVSYNFKF